MGRVLVLFILIAMTVTGRAETFDIESYGVRGGFGASSGDRAFRQYEIFARAGLPWLWNEGGHWSARTGLDFSAGVLQRHHQSGFVVQAGPFVVLEREHLPVVFEFGSSPTLISRERYENTNLGSWFHFTTYVGLRAALSERLSIGYRFQHMSNAGIGRLNPGLDIHSFSVFYRF